MEALTIAAEGGMADDAKPLKGLGSGVFEIVLPHRGNAYRVVYAVQLADAIWGSACVPEEIDAGHQEAET